MAHGRGHGRKSFRPYQRRKDEFREGWIARWRGWFQSLGATTLDHSARRQSTVPSDDTSLREFNYRLAIGSVIALLVLTPLLYVWHSFQTQRNAAAMLVQVERLEKEREWMRAADWCFRYLRLRPDDELARARLAQLYDRSAQTEAEHQRAIELYSVAAAQGGADSLKLRRRLGEMLLEVGRDNHAEDVADQLLQQNPKDPAAWRIKALAVYRHVGEGRNISYRHLADTMQKAVEFNPQDAVLAHGLADLYRRQLKDPSQEEREKLADAVMERLIKANPNSSEARLARLAYRMRFGLPGAEEDAQQALSLAPNDVEVLLAAALQEIRRAQTAKAAEYYERVVKLAPHDRRGYLGLGDALVSLGRREEAVRAWQDGLTKAGPLDVFLNLRLAETYLGAGQWEDARSALEIVERQIRTNNAQVTETAQRIRTALQLGVALVRARGFAAQQQHQQAVEELRAALGLAGLNSTAQGDIARLVEIHYQLAGSYRALRQPDLAAAAYEEAIQLQPTVMGHYLSAAAMRESAGQFDAAIRHYEQVLKLPQPPSAVWLAYAGAHLRQLKRLPEDARDWSRFQAAMARAKEVHADPTQVQRLETEALVVQGRADEARQALEQAAEAHPSTLEMVQPLIMALERQGKHEEADARLAALGERLGNTIEVVLLKANVLAQRQQFADAERSLRDALGQANPNDQAMLAQRLVQLKLQSGTREEARKLLEQFLAERPGDLQLIWLKGEMALDAGDLTAVTESEEQLRGKEGVQGSGWRYLKARRLLAQAGSDDELLLQVGQLENEIQLLRPSWPAAFVLRGMLEERRGRANEAVTAFETAIDLGDTSLVPFERIVAILFEQGRLDDVDAFLKRLGSDAYVSQDVSNAAIALSLEQGRTDRALQLAEAAAERRPDDPLTLIWLAQARTAAGQIKDAEAAYRRAVEVQPDDARAWTALLGFYIQQERTDAARETLTGLTTQVELKPASRAFVMAQGHELLGEMSEAGRNYRAAFAASSDDLQIQTRCAMFFQSRDLPRAEQAWQNVLRLDPGSDQARRGLALVLAARGDQIGWTKAWKLAGERSGGRPPEPDDLRLQATLAEARGGDEARDLVIAALERLQRETSHLEPGDRLLLARRYEEAGKLDFAIEQFRTLITAAEPEPAHLAAFAELLLRHPELGNVVEAVEQLRQAAPDSPEALRVYVRWQQQKSARPEAIQESIDEFLATGLDRASTDDARLALLGAAGELYTEAHLPAPAESCYRQRMALDLRAYRELALWLVGQGRLREAVETCLDAAKGASQSPEPIQVLCAVLLRDRGDHDFALAEPLLAEGVRRFADNADLLVDVAAIRTLARQDAQAIELYRQALKRDPEHVVALSRLGLLLSMKRDTQVEALEFVEQSLAIAGPLPSLIDARAMVLLRSGKLTDALKALRELTLLPQAEPLHWFHLALAYQKANSTEEARRAFQKAHDGKINEQLLMPADRALLGQLARVLGP